MSDFAFEPATKDQAKARIALAGPSGSGKTWTGLILATALGGRVAVIDTERGSASKYAGDFKFDRLNLHRYDPRDLAKALAAAGQAGYDVVVVDSLSKFWSGAGGMLEQVDNAAKRGYGGNSFGGWKEARPMESAMIEALLGFSGHVIVTMRTKTAFEVIEDDRGRKVPQKIGLKPEQREGIEYEFDIVGDMDLQNAMTISKSRCPALTGQVIQRPDSSLGEAILGWLTDGKPAMSAQDYRDALCVPGIGADTVKQYGVEISHRGLSGATVIDDEGETVTLRELALRKYQDAARAGRGAPESPPPAGPAKNGQRTSVPPARRPQRPGQAEKPPVATDQAWLAGFTSRASEFGTKAAGEKLWQENLAQHNAGECSDEDFGRLQDILNARLEEIQAQDAKDAAEAEAAVPA
jgi:hypothetical protein